MKKLISIFVAICMMLSIGLTTTTFTADAASPSPKIEDAGYVDILENDISSGQDGYTYNAPKPGAFVIENSFGFLSIVEGVLLLQFAGLTVRLPSVDYYRIVYKNDNLRYYQADVLEIQSQISDFVYIGIYVENGTTYTLHAQYMSDDGGKMYNIIAPLTGEQFIFFDQMSTPLCIGTDDVSDRLKSSARIYTYGTFEQNMTTTAYNSVEPMALNPIDNSTYDSFTREDGIIHEYVDEYFGECYLEDGTTYTDDPIVQIIPKQLFFIPGEHIYIGKEYGFFVSVLQDTYFLSDYAVDVMVFDITHHSPGYGENEPGIVMISPLFQFKYRASPGGDFAFDPSLTSIVFPHIHHDLPEYSLKNIGFKITVDNVDELNAGDQGYDPDKDSGAFFVQTRVNMHGVGLKEKNLKFAYDTANFVFGLIPYVGTGISVLTYWDNLNNGFGNHEYDDIRPASTNNNENNIVTLTKNHSDQISAYGNLIKTLSVQTVSNAEEPCFIHTNGGYVGIWYEINRKDDSSNNKFRIVTSISLSVVVDNGKTLSGLSIMEYGRATGTYETGNYRRLNDVTLRGFTNISFPAGTQRHIIKLTPSLSGSFKFKTISSSGDPHFYITNATKGTSTIAATDDIGSSDRNAELVIDLIAGDVYYLEVFNYRQYYQFALQIGYAPVSSEVLQADTLYTTDLPQGVYAIGSFTPTISGYYQISTNRTLGDPVLFILTNSGALLNTDDDSGGDYNACTEIYLTAGVTFYIVLHEYNGYALNTTIEITLQE